MSQPAFAPEPPESIEQLDQLIHRIDEGHDDLASLSDEQRAQLTEELCEEWVARYLDDYPVPTLVDDAIREYQEIQIGDLYPNLPQFVRDDLLMRYEDRFGEGGPEHWIREHDED